MNMCARLQLLRKCAARTVSFALNFGFSLPAKPHHLAGRVAQLLMDGTGALPINHLIQCQSLFFFFFGSEECEDLLD